MNSEFRFIDQIFALFFGVLLWNVEINALEVINSIPRNVRDKPISLINDFLFLSFSHLSADRKTSETIWLQTSSIKQKAHLFAAALNKISYAPLWHDGIRAPNDEFFNVFDSLN